MLPASQNPQLPPTNGQPNPTLADKPEYTAINQYTYGEFADEKDVAVDFDRRVEATQCFRVYREVEGHYQFRRMGMVREEDEKTPRIDRVLIPLPKILSLGWRIGAVGVELKASKLKIGHPIAQALDYSNALFLLPPANIRIQLNWVFIWPLRKVLGDCASFMSQNCIGNGYGDTYTLFRLMVADTSILTVNKDLSIETVRNPASGKKVGSR